MVGNQDGYAGRLGHETWITYLIAKDKTCRGRAPRPGSEEGGGRGRDAERVPYREYKVGKGHKKTPAVAGRGF